VPDHSSAEELHALSVVSPARAVVAVRLDGEVVLYHEHLRIVCVMDPHATAIWEALDGRSDLATVAAKVAARFGAPPEQVTADVVAAARDLGARGLLAGVSPDPDTLAALAVEGAQTEVRGAQDRTS
jgi:uncharacterized membrane protein